MEDLEEQMVARRFVRLDAAGVVVAGNESLTWPDEWERFDAQPLPAGLVDVTAETADYGDLEALHGQRRLPDGSFVRVPPPTVGLRTRLGRKWGALVRALRS